MTIQYPTGFDTLTAKSNLTAMKDDHPSVHTDIAEILMAIEAELGLTPKSTYADVADRLNHLLVGPGPTPTAPDDGKALTWHQSGSAYILATVETPSGAQTKADAAQAAAIAAAATDATAKANNAQTFAETYADTGDATTLTAAETYAAAHDTTTLTSAEAYADAHDVTTLASAAAAVTAQRNAANGLAGLDASSKLLASMMPFVVVPLGGGADDMPVIQAAYDANYGEIWLLRGQSYTFNSALFLDDAGSLRGVGGFAIHVNGAKVTLGASLPQCAEWNANPTWTNSITAKCAIFPNTKRTALSGGIVTCTGNTVTGGNGSARLKIEGPGLFTCALNDNCGLVMANNGGGTTCDGVTSQLLFLISNAAQCDSLVVRRCVMINGGCAAHSLGMGIWVFLPIYTSVGDNYSIEDCKTDPQQWTGHFIGNRSVRVVGQNGGTFRFVMCADVTIDSHHQEAIINTPSGQGTFIIDCSTVIFNGSNMRSGRGTQYTIEINDQQVEPLRSHLHIAGPMFDTLLSTGDHDPTIPPHIQLTAMNDGSKVTAIRAQCTFSPGLDGGGRTSFAPIMIGSAVSGITTALATNVAKALIAEGSFEIRQRTATNTWEVVNPILPMIALTKGIAPICNFTSVAPSGGYSTLVAGTQYAYFMATKDAAGNYGPGAQVGTLTPSAPAAAGRLKATVKDAPKVLCIWRQISAATVTAPDHYIEMPIGTFTAWLYDTGENLSCQAWSTSGIPSLPTVDASLDAIMLTDGTVSSPLLLHPDLLNAQSANYTATYNDRFITEDATGGARTVTLPTAVGCPGKEYNIKKIDSSANTVTIATTSAQTIDGVTTFVLPYQYDYLTVVSDGANWSIVQRRVNYPTFQINATNHAWPIPPGAKKLRIIPIGGGGGGAGAGSAAAAQLQAGAGAGGNGSSMDTLVDVGANTTLDITIGNGGTGGTGGALGGNPGTAGITGGDTIVAIGGVTVATGKGGGPGSLSAASSTTSVGGGVCGSNASLTGAAQPGSGGASALRGGAATGFTPAASGGGGAATATNGGGAGAAGSATTPGASGTAGASGTSAGVDGANGAANSGVGGSGGGGGAAGTGKGGNGGNGGSGTTLVQVIF